MTAYTAAAFGIASIAASSAFGHIPGVGNGLAPTTNAPDLRSVEAFASDLIDTIPEQARFCFDQNIANTVAGPALTFFALQTYDSRRSMNPTAAARDTSPGHENCAIATFAPGTDVTQATVGEVFPGAVVDLQNRTNTLASEPVTGSAAIAEAGRTTGPDLKKVRLSTVGATDKIAMFDFDENLDPSPAVAYQAANFGFYDNTDTPHTAPAGTVNVSGATATVHFGADPQIDTATRFFINVPGTVQDRPQTQSLGGLPLATPSSPDVLNQGTVSPTRPEMLSAQSLNGQDFKITFNKQVQFTPASAAGFIAISDDGSFNPAATAITAISGQPNNVIVTFPAAVAADPASIVRIFLSGGAVTTVGGALANIGGAVPTSTPNSVPGYTNGPDLLAAGVDPTTDKVTFKYDETVQDSPTPATAAFQGGALDGAPINALGGVVVGGQFVQALFSPAAPQAVIFANPYNTVFDKTGRVNPAQSVSNVLQTAPPPPPPPPGPPPPVAPPPPPPITTPRYKTTVTIKRRGATYSGTLRSARKACTQGRRVILKRNGVQARFGTAFSSRKGTYKIHRKHRIRRRVYAYVTGRATSVNCLPAKSKTING